MLEHALIRLPTTELPLDDDAVEEAREVEALDAAPLRERSAVRDQRHRHAARAQRLERLDGARIRRERLEPATAVVLRDRVSNTVALRAKVGQCQLHDVDRGL